MRALQTLHDRLRRRIPFVHALRWRAVWRAVEGLIRGRQLWLTGIGRALPTTAYRKHAIKSVDRLLGNAHLYEERPSICSALVQLLLPRGAQPVVLVDTMEIRHKFVAFTASLAFDGRSFPIWSRICGHVRPNAKECERFLNELAEVLPPNCRPVLITDGGFERTWFRSLDGRGWNYVGRIRGQVKLERKGQWCGCKDLHQLANKHRPRDLGLLRFPMGRPELRRVVLSARPRSCHRQVSTRTGHSRDSNYHHYRKNAHEPLLLATSLKCSARDIVALYKMRMQIEQSFRDLKNYRWGWSLRHCNSRSARRIEVLLLIAAIAALVQQLVGVAAERRGLHQRYQANTERRRRVLSHFLLGSFVLTAYEHLHIPRIAVEHALRDTRRAITERGRPPPS